MYKQAIVVFLDILGFWEMIGEAKDDDSKIGAIRTALLTTKVLAGLWRDITSNKGLNGTYMKENAPNYIKNIA